MLMKFTVKKAEKNIKQITKSEMTEAPGETQSQAVDIT